MIQEVQDQIRSIQLYAKRLMQANLFGHSRSTQKGNSLDFDQIRDYQLGDDVRTIDWNSSARMNKLLVKQFYDDRQRSILIALDISASCFYGSDNALKISVARTVAALLSYAAFLSKDEVGLFLFTDTQEWYIPARAGKAHVHEILEKIFTSVPQHKQTNLSAVLEKIIQLRKKNMMLFLISDFIDMHFEKQLSAVAHQYDTVAIRIADRAECVLNVSGLITIQDCETDEQYIIKAGAAITAALQDRLSQQKKMFIANRIDILDINFKKPAIDQLIHFFQLRKR